MERKLASIQRIAALEPIPGADRIELARVLGWQCVVKKDEFKVGDLGVYLEIDSVPPDRPVFAFLWSKPGYEPRPRPSNTRVRTIRLRGQISQGLMLPISMLFGAPYAALRPELLIEGQDVTELLDIIKYEPKVGEPGGVSADARGPFPSCLPKTDETRVQSVPGVLEELRGRPYVVTEKLDGTSATYLIDPSDGTFHACSRRQSVRDDGNFYWELARKLKLHEILAAEPRYAVQGEICGPGIQGNKLRLPAKQFFAFNVWDLEAAKYLDYTAAQEWLSEKDITMVPNLGFCAAFDETVESLLRLAEGRYAGTENEREGIVIRPIFETYSQRLHGRLSFKVVSNRFLLAEVA